MTQFSIKEILNLTKEWILNGNLNPDILAESFQLISPFWKSNNREEVIEKFQTSNAYREVLGNIVHFDPVLDFIGLDGVHFAIIFQYHTKNSSHVFETLLCRVSNGLLVELRSIYDLAETKEAHGLN